MEGAVRDTTMRAAPSSVDQAGLYLGILTRLFAWATLTAGLAIDPVVVLHPRTIGRYVAVQHASVAERTRRRYEQRLLEIASAVADDRLATPSRRTGPPRSAPYTVAEIPAFFSWVDTHSTPRLCRNAAVVLSLAGGAGLRAREIWAATSDDIHIVGGVVSVTVAEGSRVVPLLRSWSRPLSELLPALAAGERLIDTARAADRNPLLTDQLNRGGPDPERLRSTWVVTHLNAGVPVGDLLHVAALRGVSALERYMPFTVSSPDAVTLLSGKSVTG